MPVSEAIPIGEAKTRLSELVRRVEAGEEIVLRRGSKRVARLVPEPAIHDQAARRVERPSPDRGRLRRTAARVRRPAPLSDLLLDTHVVLWWLADDPRLGAAIRDEVMRASAVHVSAATTWEVAIKSAIGRLDLDDDATFPAICEAQGFSLVGVDHRDAWAVRDLPPSRTDPFDRLIAATARRRGWIVVSADPVFDGLGVAVLRP